MRTLGLLFLITWTVQAQEKAVLVIHGGAGVRTDEELKSEGATREEYEQALAASLRAGWKAMQTEGKTSVDGVEAAIRVMEDSPLFNAGRGAVLTKDGRAELDASIMIGRMDERGEGKTDPRKRGGAITGVTHVKNPISAARAVMEMPNNRHSFLAGAGAEDYVLGEEVRKKYAIEKVNNQYFWTDYRLQQIRTPKAPNPKKVSLAEHASRNFGTVGAVAVKNKRIAAGTSTGGLTAKWPGRVGDTPILGAGNYADDRACGVSGTGTGELFMRHVVAHDVCARMIYKKIPVAQAAQEAIDEMPDEDGGVGGLIALDAEGHFAFPVSAKCAGMSRGFITATGDVYVAFGAKQPWKKVDALPAK